MPKLIPTIAFILSMGFAHVSSAQKKGLDMLDSMVAELPKFSEDTNKVKALERISFMYATFNTAEGLRFGNEALKLSNALKWHKGIGISYNAIGNNYLVLREYDQAEESFTRSYHHFDSIKLKRGIATSYGNLGIVYQDRNRHAKALEFYTKSLELYSEICYKSGIANQLNNIGNIYLDIEDYPMALKWFNRSIEVSREINNKFYLAIRHNNCSYVYRCQGLLTQAKTSGNMALELSNDIKDKYCLSLSYKNLGAIYLEEKKLDSANAYFNKSLQLASEINSRHRMQVALGYLGLNHLAMMMRDSFSMTDDFFPMSYKKPGSKNMKKQDHYNIAFIDSFTMVMASVGFTFDSSILYLDSAIKVGNAINEIFYTMDYHRALYKVYMLKGDKTNAIKHLEIYQNMKSTYLTEEQVKEIRKTGKDKQGLIVASCY